MNPGKLIAILNITLAFSASIGYFVSGNTRMGLYWLFAGLIGMTVTV